MDELLRLSKLSKTYFGSRALDGVDLVIHRGEIVCLVGTNGSGKSTLIKCISGVEAPDSGEIVWDGESHASLTPPQAMRMGIQVIYQDLSIFPDLTVAENVAFHHLQDGSPVWVNWTAARDIAERQLAALGVDLPLEARLGDLSVGARQIVAIARALTRKCRLLIMDEPTTALSSGDTARLLAIVRRLKEAGIAVVFVSHKLDELFEIADVFQVIRDGVKVGDFQPVELDTRRLGYLMTGLHFVIERGAEIDAAAPELLRVEGLTRRGHYHDVGFALHAGETIGFCGLMGSGRTEVALSLFGLNPPDSGTITVEGRPIRPRMPSEAIAAGIALVSEDRHTQGLFPRRTIDTNIVSSIYRRIRSAFGLISGREEEKIGAGWMERVRVKARSGAALAKSLSGGNQQKVVLAKWLATEPKILILDNPTVGIDVGSKQEIHRIVQDMAQRKCGILVISDDLEELALVCQRVFVMRRGTLAEEIRGADLSLQRLTESLRDAA